MITVVRLAATPLRYRMAIQKLNNIMINRPTNPQSSVLPDKWRFDASQDCNVLKDDFNSVSSKIIPNATLQAIGFYHSPLCYLEEGALRFVDVTNKLEIAI